MRYQIRHAAGLYWLLDMYQEGVPYKAPLAMNEMGASIWEMMAGGMGTDEIIDTLAARYQENRETIAHDVEQFRSRLEAYGIAVT